MYERAIMLTELEWKGVSNKENSHGLCPGEASFAANEIGLFMEREKARVTNGRK